MEVLFNTHRGKTVAEEVSRLCAILLGRDRVSKARIRSEVIAMYRKRSKVVHYGQTGLVMEEDVLKLRAYVRESINEMLARGLDKEELLQSLH